MTIVVRMKVKQAIPIGNDFTRVSLEHMPDNGTDFKEGSPEQAAAIMTVRKDSEMAKLLSIGGNFHISMVEEEVNADTEGEPADEGHDSPEPLAA